MNTVRVTVKPAWSDIPRFIHALLFGYKITFKVESATVEKEDGILLNVISQDKL